MYTFVCLCESMDTTRVQVSVGPQVLAFLRLELEALLNYLMEALRNEPELAFHGVSQ